MYKLLVILLVVLMGTQASYQGLIYAYYAINKDYIKKQLCENKDQPALKCDGKCHLKKVLAISKNISVEEPQPFLPSLEEIKMPVLFFQALYVKLFDSINESKDTFLSEKVFEYLFMYRYLPTFGAFHPPRH